MEDEYLALKGGIISRSDTVNERMSPSFCGKEIVLQATGKFWSIYRYKTKTFTLLSDNHLVIHDELPNPENSGFNYNAF